MGRLTLIGLVVSAALACAACGGGKQDAAAGHRLPKPLVERIQAEVLKQPVILGASSATSIDVYGPASHAAIEQVSSPGSVSETRVAGKWYLLVLHGQFAWNAPVPAGSKQPHGKIALEVWSPKTSAGGAYSVGNRVPKAVSRLKSPTVIHLS